MIRRLLVATAIAALAAACASTPRSNTTGVPADPREKDPAFRYGSNPGPSPVGVIPDVVVRDAQRNRDVKVNIEYPIRSGSYPLIVHSHAGGGSNRSYAGLSSHWTGYGYVVIRVAHADNDVPADELTTAQWRDRVRDVTLVLDNLTSLTERYPELQQKIDATRVAVSGHSRGAVTAMMLGGLRTFPGGETFADPRVKAIVVMSPVGPFERWGITSESFAQIRVPALFMTGSRDTGSTDAETPEWRAQAYELAPAGDKWLVNIEGVQHGTFTGQVGVQLQDVRPTPAPTDISITGRIPTVSPQDVERERMARARQSGLGERALFSQLRALALAFLDTYLKDEEKGREFLREADARGHVAVTSK